MPTTRSRTLGLDSTSSGEATSAATLTLRRGRMRGWRTLAVRFGLRTRLGGRT